MKSLIFAVSLSAALIAWPAIAQQGPAGVPGAYGLAESVAPTPPTAQEQRVVRGPADCSQARNPQQCESRKQASAQCQNQNGAQFRKCVQQKMPPADCSKSPDPVRCEQHQKARLLCQDKPGPEHRQCLRDNLTAKK